MATDAPCVLFVGVALIAHATWLSQRRPWQLVVALLALWPAFLAKESGVVAPVGMALMTLLLPRGVDEHVGSPAGRGGDLEGPGLAMLIAYLALYRALGFGGLTFGPLQ